MSWLQLFDAAIRCSKKSCHFQLSICVTYPSTLLEQLVDDYRDHEPGAWNDYNLPEAYKGIIHEHIKFSHQCSMRFTIRVPSILTFNFIRITWLVMWNIYYHSFCHGWCCSVHCWPWSKDKQVAEFGGPVAALLIDHLRVSPRFGPFCLEVLKTQSLMLLLIIICWTVSNISCICFHRYLPCLTSLTNIEEDAPLMGNVVAGGGSTGNQSWTKDDMRLDIRGDSTTLTTPIVIWLWQIKQEVSPYVNIDKLWWRSTPVPPTDPVGGCQVVELPTTLPLQVMTIRAHSKSQLPEPQWDALSRLCHWRNEASRTCTWKMWDKTPSWSLPCQIHNNKQPVERIMLEQ